MTNDYAWSVRLFCSSCGGPHKAQRVVANPTQTGYATNIDSPGAKMTTDDGFAELMLQVRGGDQAAAWKLIEVYGVHVLKVIRRSLNSQLRSKFDSQDFVQAVWKSFFCDREKLLAMQSPAQLVAYIQAVARNKVVDETRRRQTAKYNVSRELQTEFGVEDVAGRGPRPSEVAVFRETWERLIANQSAQHQRIVELRFQGWTFDEIAEELKINERTARRVIASLLEKDVR